MQLNEALERFVLQLRADGRSEHTMGQYRRAIGTLRRWLAREGRGSDLAAITPEVLAAFLVSPDARQSVHGGPKRTASVNALRTGLRVFFAWVHEAGYASTNAARLIRRAICSPPPPKGLSEVEAERLMAAVAGGQGPTARRDHLLVHLLLATGIRLGSAIALDVDDVDLANGRLWLRHLKGDREDRVFLSGAVQEHLTTYLARNPASGPVFCGPAGERLSKRQAQRRITLWLARAGIERGTPHALRHTFACELLRRTGDLFLVKEALLHRSIVSTTVYAGASETRLRAALG